ncbi:MAG: hypothetical protein ACWGO1_07230 [Anaerolineales bacterium]
MLSPRDRYNPDIPALTEEVLPISNLSRIEAVKPDASFPPQEIFGDEPFHSWCYYYQTAELARQSGDWQRVIELAGEAASAGYEPPNPHERQPFIEAYAHTGQWEAAFSETRKAYRKDDRYADQLCYLWLEIEEAVNIPDDTLQGLEEMRESMHCQDNLTTSS